MTYKEFLAKAVESLQADVDSPHYYLQLNDGRGTGPTLVILLNFSCFSSFVYFRRFITKDMTAFANKKSFFVVFPEEQRVSSHHIRSLLFMLDIDNYCSPLLFGGIHLSRASIVALAHEGSLRLPTSMGTGQTLRSIIDDLHFLCRNFISILKGMESVRAFRLDLSSGAKRYVILPPSQCDKLYLYDKKHPEGFGAVGC
jgi:hypothetical protein